MPGNWTATSLYQLEVIGMKRPDNIRLADQDLTALIQPGTLVRTSYNTGPYTVVRIVRFEWIDPDTGVAYPHWSLACDWHEDDGHRHGWPKARYWLNNLVPEGGRIRHLLNNDELEVLGHNPAAEAKLFNRAQTGDLFAV
jgi:hypothetical protein